MRILFIIHNYPPHHIAGTEQYTVNLTRELTSAHEHTVAVLHPVYTADVPDFTLRQRSNEEGTPVYEILGGTHEFLFGFGQQPDRQDRFMAQVQRALDEFQPDLVHIQHLMGFPVLPLLSELKTRRLPVMQTLHDFWLICPRYHLLRADGRLCAGPRHGLWTCAVCRQGRPPLPLADAALALPDRLGVLPLLAGLLPATSTLGTFLRRDEIAAQAAALIDHFISPSHALAARIQSGGIDIAPVTVIPPGLTPLADSPLARAPHQPDTPLQVGYLGILAPHKGLDVLLDAAAQLTAAAPGQIALHLHGYGETNYENALASRVADLLNVTLHGRYQRADLGHILAALDAVVVPSICFDNAPTVINEAFQHGVPVIGSDLGGIPEMLGGGAQGGLLVPPGDAEALAAALLRLRQEPNLLPRLRASVPPVWSLADHVATLLRLYEELLAAA